MAVQQFFRLVRLSILMVGGAGLGGGLLGCAIPSAESFSLTEAGPIATEARSEVARLALSGPAVARYVVVDPKTLAPTGAEAVMQRDGPREDGTWRLRIGWRPEAGARVRWMQQVDGDTAPDDSLRLLSIRDASSRRSAIFEPGLVVAPGMLGGSAQIQELSVSLAEPDGQRRLRAKHTIASAGRELIETPAGTRAALRVHLDSVVSLGPVTGRRQMAVWLAEGQGVVAQYQSDTLLVLGIPTKTREMLLVAAPAETGDGGEPDEAPGRLISADGEVIGIGQPAEPGPARQ